MKKRTYTYDYPRPAVTADSVVFCNGSDGLSVLLIERANDPFKGCWAFPGGFMDMEENAEDCAKRELKEETGMEVRSLEYLGTFSEVNRDPRGRTITIAYYAVVEKSDVIGADDASRAKWFPIDSIPSLAFDHEDILRAALKVLNDLR